MLSLALITPNAFAAEGIEQLTQESGLFKVIFKGTPATPAGTLLRTLFVHDPELILLDLEDWETAAPLAAQIFESGGRAVVIGFRSAWTDSEQASFAELGVLDLVPDPFSAAQLEAAAYEALHRKRPVAHANILAFLPSKAGGGCSTVTLNTAALLAKNPKQRVLIIEGDRRSGVLSIMLNAQPGSGLADALSEASDLSGVKWHQHYKSAFGMHLLLANPAQRGPLPSWVDFYHLLHFVQKHYDFIFVDLPEVVNGASAELVRAARSVFVVCTPEIPSLKMAEYRCAELEGCEIPSGNIHIVLNRFEPGRFAIKDIEAILQRPVFGTLPNDYTNVTNAIMDSELVAEDSNFAEGCRQLAQKLSGLPEAPRPRSKFDLLLKLSRLSS